MYSQILGISAISVINNDRIYNKRMGSNKFLDVRTIIRSFHCLPPATKRKQCFKCNVVGKLVLKSSVDTTRYLHARKKRLGCDFKLLCSFYFEIF